MYFYIMGRGHSGSTILDVLLGNNSEIESVGEILSGVGRFDPNKKCSCGATVSDCSFWRAVRSQVEAEDFVWQEATDISEIGAGGLWRVARARRTDPAVLRRVRVTRALMKAITTVAGKPHLLDSSKTPARGLMLLRHVPEARVIHLVRDPRQILQSYLWRLRNGRHLYSRHLGLIGHSAPLFLAWMAASWTLVNLICEMMTRAFPGRVMRVRFEDLCAQPVRELDRIGRAFGLDMTDLAGKALGREPLAVGHNLDGNRMRHSGTVRFEPGGGRQQPRLPRWLEVVTVLLCGPLMWRYDYRLRDNPSRVARTAPADGHLR